MTQAPRITKFYKKVSVEACEQGFGVCLDGKQAKTLSRKPLATHSHQLADAVADEWRAQGDHIERHAMPLTGMLSSVIESGAEKQAEWREEVLNYLCSDLLCYRAETPSALVDRPCEIWDPYLSWFQVQFGASLISTSGVISVEQPEEASQSVRAELEKTTAETLLALRIVTGILGSAVLALALWKKAKTPEEIFEASRVDERFQQSQWGADHEASEREEKMRAEFLSAARFLDLV